MNIADEYINEKKRFGHWKDCALKVEGEAVKNFTAMFLETFDATSKGFQITQNTLTAVMKSLKAADTSTPSGTDQSRFITSWSALTP
ncbi:MAG: hypothetical protein K2N33_01695 [Clostridia bacterium]|nr:hypothetical protein [Clostridia bacterium]